MLWELWEVLKVTDSKLEAFNSHIKKEGNRISLQERKKSQALWKRISLLCPAQLAIKNKGIVERVWIHLILYAMGMAKYFRLSKDRTSFIMFGENIDLPNIYLGHAKNVKLVNVKLVNVKPECWQPELYLNCATSI